MPVAINALSGVQWTELNGSGLTAQETTDQKALLAKMEYTIAYMQDEINNAKRVGRPPFPIDMYTDRQHLSLEQFNRLTGSNFTTNYGRLTLSLEQMSTLLTKLKEASYLEASKLSVQEGGGIKTFNGKWFANGQTLSYLDVTFAVRVNQLSVINDTFLGHLAQIQKNNILIKNANALSAILTANAPPSSSGSTAISTFQNQIVTGAINAGTITVSSNYATKALAQTALATAAIGSCTLYTGTNGKPYWLVKITANQYNGSLSYEEVNYAGIINYTTPSLTPINVQFDFAKLTAMFPASASKLFNITSGTTTGTFKTGTLSQTDITTMTTELKSYTSNLESNSQVAQTQIDQYNNKRAEVLDNMTNITKGNNTTLNTIGRNFSALN